MMASILGVNAHVEGAAYTKKDTVERKCKVYVFSWRAL
jgi:hypothetical protein